METREDSAALNPILSELNALVAEVQKNGKTYSDRYYEELVKEVTEFSQQLVEDKNRLDESKKKMIIKLKELVEKMLVFSETSKNPGTVMLLSIIMYSIIYEQKFQSNFKFDEEHNSVVIYSGEKYKYDSSAFKFAVWAAMFKYDLGKFYYEGRVREDSDDYRLVLPKVKPIIGKENHYVPEATADIKFDEDGSLHEVKIDEVPAAIWTGDVPARTTAVVYDDYGFVSGVGTGNSVKMLYSEGRMTPFFMKYVPYMFHTVALLELDREHKISDPSKRAGWAEFFAETFDLAAPVEKAMRPR